MPNLKYILPRVIRHFLPEAAVSFLLKNGLIIRPGLETLSPEKAVKRYLDQLKLHKLSLVGKRVMVFGYGGNLTIGCLLLEAGAHQLVLCEREGFCNDLKMEELGKRFPQYFLKDSNGYKINPKFIILYHGDIAKITVNSSFEKIDLVLSTSVFEHLKDPDQVTKSLAQLTNPNGSHLHFIDLRDHFFKYPFEMLCYSNSVWERWLNPTSNLNRFRISDYRKLFKNYFSETIIVTEERDLENFSVSRSRIQTQFLRLNDEEDSATQIHLVASTPKRNIQN
jgi:SAM-dependent methyltransferase